MKNSFGLPYFYWHKGFIFNEGGKYFTFTCIINKGRLLIRVWIGLLGIEIELIVRRV